MARPIDQAAESGGVPPYVDVDAAPDRSMSRVGTLFGRAIALRCPVCGQGGLFASWFDMRHKCPTCGFALEREEGYFTGAMCLNLIVTEFSLAGVLFALMIASWPLVTTWPSQPLVVAWIASIVASIVLPLAFFPFAKIIWVAFDLVFRPPTARDFEKEIPRVR